MVKTTEGWHTLPDGEKLYTKSWEPDGPATSILVFLHGFSDHCNAYYNLFPTLASAPYSIAVHSFDQRGWGRSVHLPTQRGLTGPTSLVLSDIYSFMLSINTKQDGEDLPLFLMGHSMGGGEALNFMLAKSPPQATSPAKHESNQSSSPKTLTPLPPIRGLLLESPLVALDPAAQPWKMTVWVGKLAAKVTPSRQMVQKLDSAALSRSATVRKDWEDDPLCHDTGTLEGLAGMLQRMHDLDNITTDKKSPLKLDPGCPVWVGHGSEDHVTSFPGSKRLFERLQVKANGGDKTFRTYQGAYHKLHAEPEGVAETFVREVGEWVLAHAGKTEASTTAAKARL